MSRASNVVHIRDVTTCRLCGGELHTRFHLQVLGRYDVAYHECDGCGSLQTDAPHWLDEAYGSNLSQLDTGAAQRNLHNFAAVLAISKLFGLRNVVDVGGGDGLLCRMLRDSALNCFVTDKFASPTYAQGFTRPDFDAPDLVLAFEILEHFAEPRVDLDAQFATGAPVVLATTSLWSGQGKDWWYLVPNSGQHVFFYSERSLQLVAERFGYRLLITGGFLLFVRKGFATPLQWRISGLLLRPGVCRLIRALAVYRATPGVATDFAAAQRALAPRQPPT